MEESSKEQQHVKENLPRSQSWSALREGARPPSGRKQSDSFIDDSVGPAAPIQHAQSYKLTANANNNNTARTSTNSNHSGRRNNNAGAEPAGVKRLMESLSEPSEPSTSLSRQSAASLKVHFQSIDDISDEADDNDGTDDIETGVGTADCWPDSHSRRRTISGN